jgi:hypothetical protein
VNLVQDTKDKNWRIGSVAGKSHRGLFPVNFVEFSIKVDSKHVRGEETNSGDHKSVNNYKEQAPESKVEAPPLPRRKNSRKHEEFDKISIENSSSNSSDSTKTNNAPPPLPSRKSTLSKSTDTPPPLPKRNDNKATPDLPRRSSRSQSKSINYEQMKQRYGDLFDRTDVDKKGHLTGSQVKQVYKKSMLDSSMLASIW